MKVHRNCCGLDVHKQTIAACLIREDVNGNTSKEKRIFGTMTQQLRELAQWLLEAKVSAVAMEATGVYGGQLTIGCRGHSGCGAAKDDAPRRHQNNFRHLR